MVDLAKAILGVRRMVIAVRKQDDRGYDEGFDECSDALDNVVRHVDELTEALRKDG
jgi:translation elongation factor EF-1alpha